MVTVGEALRTIKEKVRSGQYRVAEHLAKDHPERRISNAEMVGALMRAHAATKDADEDDRWHVVGPSLRPPPAKLHLVVTIEANLIIITAWRTAR